MTGVGVVGYGYWGPNLARNFQNCEHSEFKVCCDADPARLLTCERLYPSVKTTTSFGQVLEDPAVEAVVIATPARTHHGLARQALLAGKHVLVEKPLAMTAAECEELTSLAEQTERVLMVGHTFLYHPAVIKARELVRNNTLGDLYYLYSQRLNLGRVQTDINALWSLAPHDIAIAIYLLGRCPTVVSATGTCLLNPGNEDVVFVSMAFPGGILANIHVSWLDPRKLRMTTLVGSKGMAVFDDINDEDKLRVYDKRAIPVDSNHGDNEQANNSLMKGTTYKLHSGDIYVPRIPVSEPLANECRHFIECIQEGKRPLTDGRNGVEIARVLEAAQRSLKMQGLPVPVLPVHTCADDWRLPLQA